ncbi:3-oxoacyl-ACP reductase family protein [Spirosoma pollinicola]|uniref:3-oxoacyl-ACP reductase n=1 Tax=Spirosoma pollinicola TaxID=2057025 RepID=A0A2K8Z3G7_9BACT|nr:3-oxoacyl-ACP reductase family protein [Spirosoma pollinicola]AUD04427.1 3-oxoacyl-ACP reductase [Spirosoma pollinicola]
MNEQIILVTGGSRGIGRSICLTLAERGCTVLFTYLSSADKALSLIAEIDALNGGRAYGYQCDMSDLKQVQALAARFRKEHGRLSGLVNNAGILGDGKPFLMGNDDNWWNVMRTNVGSVTNTCRIMLPLFIAQRRGRIINMTSISGQKGNAGQSAYSASKSAIVTFSKTLAKEVTRFGISVNCVSPGLIETDMTADVPDEYVASRLTNMPMKRKGNVEEVANLVAYLLCDAPNYMVGQELTIDGGLAIS